MIKGNNSIQAFITSIIIIGGFAISVFIGSIHTYSQNKKRKDKRLGIYNECEKKEKFWRIFRYSIWIFLSSIYILMIGHNIYSNNILNVYILSNLFISNFYFLSSVMIWAVLRKTNIFEVRKYLFSFLMFPLLAALRHVFQIASNSSEVFNILSIFVSFSLLLNAYILYNILIKDVKNGK